MNNKGFTLIELVIVIGIVGVLTGGLAFYGRSAERQIILFRDQAKIVAALLKAKSLTISTYSSEADAPCGYGVSFDQPSKTIIIFKDRAVNPNCSDADNVYTGNSPCIVADLNVDCELEKLTLDAKTIEFSNLTLKDIVYIPPNPDVIITDIDGVEQTSAQIEIQTFDGAVKRTITIINNGQITTQ